MTIPQAARHVERLARILGKYARRCATREAALWSLADDLAHNIEQSAKSVGAEDAGRDSVLDYLRGKMPRLIHRAERLRRRVFHVRKMLSRAETKLRALIQEEKRHARATS